MITRFAVFCRLWSQVGFARQQTRSLPRLAVLHVQNIAAPSTKHKTCRRAGICVFCGHCIKKLEPISNRTPDFARAERVVALTQKVRSDRMRTPPPPGDPRG